MNPQIEVRLKALEEKLKGECDKAKGHDVGLVDTTGRHGAISLAQIESILTEVSSILKLFNPPAPAPAPAPKPTPAPVKPAAA
jgi:hypothetical protein